MTDELKAEREAFNKWAEKEMDIDYKWQYAHPVFRDRLNIAWEAWQARAQLNRTHTTGGNGGE